MYLPHLRQAILTAMRVEELEKMVAVERAALKRINVGIVAIQKDGSVVSINDAAVRIFGDNDGLALLESGLKAAHAQDDRKLHEIIASVFSDDPAMGHNLAGRLLINRPSGLPPYSVSVGPCKMPGSMCFGVEPRIVLLINDAGAESAHTEEQIASLHGLTFAEARLAKQLAAGATLQEASEKLEISRNTARTHLQSIFRKTSTNRQSELVRMLTLSLGTQPH